MTAAAPQPEPDVPPQDDAPQPEGAAALSEALGGAQGVAESSVPAVAYVAAYTISGQETTPAIVVAVAIAAVMALVRLARRETLTYALSGLAGVGLAAFIAARSGRAEDFFLPGLLLNAGYGGAYLVSILVRRPLLGVLLGMVTGEGMRWRTDPVKLRAYTRASWIWVGLFGARLAVQLPLYLAGEVVVLGVARVAMGLPLFLVGAWLSYLVLRRDGVLAAPAVER